MNLLNQPQSMFNLNNQDQIENLMGENRKKLDSFIHVQKYCLPFIFTLSISYQSVHSSKGIKIIKCEGILCHENGYPVCLKKWRFFLANYCKYLGKFYHICRQTYHIKFITKIQQLSQSHFSEQKIYEKVQTKLKENLEMLYQFFIRLGVLKHNEKSMNRLRYIYGIGAVKKQMDEILNLHATVYDPVRQSVIENQARNNKQNQNYMAKQKQAYSSTISQQTNQSLTETSSIISTTQSKTNQIFSTKPRKCCGKEYKSNREDYPQADEFNSPITKVNKIQILNTDRNSKVQENLGGYFSVRKYEAALTIKNPQSKDEQKITQQIQQEGQANTTYTYNEKLAVKQLKKQFQGNPKYHQKIQHELNIVKKIKNNPHICKYYSIEKEQKVSDENQKYLQINKSFINPESQAIYMESLVVSLKEILNKELFYNQFQVIKQLLASVFSLHENGIVHRDIKPGNIMFNFNGQLKLIDFSQSIECWRKLEKQINKNASIGFTLPYSPLECSVLSSDGYSNMKIDNWSVGMTIIQLLIGSLPVCYAKSMASSIKAGWPTEEFHWCMNLRRNCFTDELLLPLKILCLKMMRFQAKQRLCLESVFNYLKKIERLFL